MKILFTLCVLLLLFGCGGGGGGTEISDDSSNNNISIQPENDYTDDESIILLLGAMSLAEGALQISDIISAEFNYFYLSNDIINYRTCENNGKVAWNHSSTTPSKGQLVLDFQNCLLTYFPNKSYEQERFNANGQVTLNYEILSTTDSNLNDYRKPGVVKYSLDVTHSVLSISEPLPNRPQVFIEFEFALTSEQEWNTNEYNINNDGYRNREIIIESFYAPIITNNYDSLTNTNISQSFEESDTNYNGESYKMTLEGQFLSGFDNTTWQMESNYEISLAGGSPTGRTSINNENNLVVGVADNFEMSLLYNQNILGYALIYDLFDTDTLWYLKGNKELTDNTQRITPLTIIESNEDTFNIFDDSQQLELTYNKIIDEAYIDLFNLENYFASTGSATFEVLDNKLIIKPPKNEEDNVIGITVQVGSKFSIDHNIYKFTYDRFNRGEFSYGLGTYLPTKNIFLSSNSSTWLEKNEQGKITNVFHGHNSFGRLCYDKQNKYLILEQDYREKHIKVDIDTYELLDEYPNAFMTINSIDNYCNDVNYKQKTGSAIIEQYTFSTKQGTVFENSEFALTHRVLPNPLSNNSIYILANTMHYDESKIQEFTLLDNSAISNEKYVYNSELYNNNNFFLVSEEEGRIYTPTRILDLYDPSYVIHKFNDTSILYVDKENHLIVTYSAIYNSENFDKVMDLSFIDNNIFLSKVIKTNDSYHFKLNNDVDFILKINQIMK
ncbi:hypothetical protein [Pseudoalteromonas sp.]|uniref:hypothetical protein n=1 Tax=Pseudoalteromonas sp. TaxID=53249 RepID=UPI003D0B0054